MTVEELIEKLKTMDSKKIVFYDDDEYGPQDLTKVSDTSIFEGTHMARSIPKNAIFLS